MSQRKTVTCPNPDVLAQAVAVRVLTTIRNLLAEPGQRTPRQLGAQPATVEAAAAMQPRIAGRGLIGLSQHCDQCRNRGNHFLSGGSDCGLQAYPWRRIVAQLLYEQSSISGDRCLPSGSSHRP